MRAARMIEQGRVEVTEEPRPVPADGQALVRAHRASICGSDLHIVFDGHYGGSYPAPPGFPGHEGVGRVEESRAEGLEPGDWVLAVPHPPGARCYAEFYNVDATSLIGLPAGWDPDRWLLAQQRGTVVFAFRRHWPTATFQAEGKTAAICGAGSAGLFFLQLPRLAGFEKVLVSDTSELRLEIARRLGADVCVRVPAESFVEAVLALTDGEGADLTIEAVGLDETRIECLEAVRRNGRVGYFGFPEHPQGPSVWSYNAAWRKTPTIETVTGTQGETGLRSFREAVELIASGRVSVEPFLEPVYPLEEIQEALEAAYGQRGGKIAVEM